MTKQEIIDLLYNEIGNPDYKTVGDYHKGIADTLLAKFEQEKKELIEKNHKLLNQIEELTSGKCALRCPLVLQEKKEQAREIFNRIFDDDSAGDL